MTWSSYFWLRSAGFTFEALLGLTALHGNPALDRYEALRDEIESLQGRLLDIVQRQAPEAAAKLERKFAAGMAANATEMPSPVRHEMDALLRQRNSLLERAACSLEELQHAFGVEQKRNRQFIVAWLAAPAAREALFLSNPESLQRIDALIEQGVDKLDSRSRQRLRLGWNYLQRFCAKNDTSSFFGPIAWGRFNAEGVRALIVERLPGPWLASRKTFFEHWVVLRLAQAIEADSALAGALPVSLSPGCHYQDGVLHMPIARQHALDGLGRAMLDMICGSTERLARDVLVDRLATEGHDAAYSAELLSFLLAKKVLLSTLAVPTGTAMPLQKLAGMLHALPAPDSAKNRWLAVLEELESLRQRFERGALPARSEALDAMRAVLQKAGIDLSRAQGRMYVGRFPVYEDCGRNLHVKIGTDLTQRLHDEMQPVIALYRWLAGAVAVRLHDRYLACWQTLRERGAGNMEETDFLQLLTTLQAQPYTEQVTGEIRVLLQECWRQLGQGREHADEIHLTVDDMSRLLALLHQREPRAQDFPGIGTRVHSPDFMLAARDEQAIADGDYRIVIGEVHPAVHTVSQPVAQPFCPYAEEVRAEVEQLLAPHTAVIADSPQTYQRSHIDWLDVPSLKQVVLPDGVGRVAAESCLPAGRGKVVLDNGMLVYVDRATGFMQDFLTVNPGDMHRACFALAADLVGHVLSPRIVHGRLIVKRRSWNVAIASLPQGGQPGEDLHSYLRWRRWGQAAGMPRFVFVKPEHEPKPVYVDFCNPLSLDLLAGMAKGEGMMRFSEMRPAPEELWLHDEQGRYCSEFRTSYVAGPDAPF